MITFKARKLASSVGFRPHEQEDIQQELALHVVERMRRFDPARASQYTFADRILGFEDH